MRIFQVGSMFSVFACQFEIVHMTDRNSPLAWLTNKHSQFKTFPKRVPIKLSQIAFSIIVLPKDDRTDSFREERLGLPSRTMMWAICASADVSKYLDILTLEL